MNIYSRRRAVLTALAPLLAAALPLAGLQTFGAAAQEQYPDKPVRIVVGFAAGGPSDILTRVVAASMSKTLGQPVVIENRTGASGNIATEFVANSAPDGYTLMASGFINPVNVTMFKADDKLTQVAVTAETGLVLVIHPSLNVKSVKELVELAKANPDTLNYATAGRGTATHLAAELFSKAAGIKMTAVHYKGGGDAIKDLLAGEVKVMFSTIPPVLSLIKDNKLIGLATTGSKKEKLFPDLNTVAESGMPGYEVLVWVGMAAPENLPEPITTKLADSIKTALEEPDVLAALEKQGYAPKFLAAAEANAFYDAEIARWADVANAIGE